MNFKHSLLFIFISISAQVFSQSLTANEIVIRSIAACGGKEALQAANTMYVEMEGEIEDRQVTRIVKEMAPNKWMSQILFNGITVYKQAFNGKIGYHYTNGKKSYDSSGFENLSWKKNIFSELDYLDTSLATLGLIGLEKVGKAEAYKIRASLKKGSSRYLYHSTKTFLLLKEERISSSTGTVTDVALYDKYKRFDNILVPTKFTLTIQGIAQPHEMTIKSVYFNQDVSDSDFR